MTELYRGELDRVTIIAAVLTWVFSRPDNPHYLLLIGMPTVMTFHVVESRRYQRYDVWRVRIRLLERNVFVAAIDPASRADHSAWQSELGTDLRRPAFKIPFIEAYARRYLRVYLPLQTVLLVAWIVRLTVFGGSGSACHCECGRHTRTGGVAFVYGSTAILAIWPRERKATGEMYNRDKGGDWKP